MKVVKNSDTVKLIQGTVFFNCVMIITVFISIIHSDIVKDSDSRNGKMREKSLLGNDCITNTVIYGIIKTVNSLG